MTALLEAADRGGFETMRLLVERGTTRGGRGRPTPRPPTTPTATPAYPWKPRAPEGTIPCKPRPPAGTIPCTPRAPAGTIPCTPRAPAGATSQTGAPGCRPGGATAPAGSLRRPAAACRHWILVRPSWDPCAAVIGSLCPAGADVHAVSSHGDNVADLSKWGRDGDRIGEWLKGLGVVRAHAHARPHGAEARLAARPRWALAALTRGGPWRRAHTRTRRCRRLDLTRRALGLGCRSKRPSTATTAATATMATMATMATATTSMID